MLREYILALGLSRVLADMPVFCDSTCTVHITSKHVLRYIYMRVPRDKPAKVNIQCHGCNAGDKIEWSVRYPLKYPHLNFTDSSGNVYSHTEEYESNFNVYLQTAEFKPRLFITNASSSSSSSADADDEFATLECHGDECSVYIDIHDSDATDELLDKSILFFVGKTHRLTVREVLALPISMFNAHGHYYTQQGYFWIFLIVAAVVATIYAAFARLRPWQACLVYAMAAFTTVGCEKLYHSILTQIRVDAGAATATYAILVISLLAEGVPLVSCMVFMQRGKYRPIPWGIVGMVIAVGFLFLAGSGWYVGVGLLAIASASRILSRLL